MLPELAPDLGLITNGPVYKNTHMLAKIANSLVHPVEIGDRGDVMLAQLGLVCQLLPDLVSVIHAEESFHILLHLKKECGSIKRIGEITAYLYFAIL